MDTNFKVNVSELLRLSQLLENSSDDILRRISRMKNYVIDVPNSWNDKASNIYTDKFDKFLNQLTNLANEYKRISYIIKSTVDDYQQCDKNSSYVLTVRSSPLEDIDVPNDLLEKDEHEYDVIDSYKSLGEDVKAVTNSLSDVYEEATGTFSYVDNDKRIKKVNKSKNVEDTFDSYADIKDVYDYEDTFDSTVDIEDTYDPADVYAVTDGKYSYVDKEDSYAEIKDYYDQAELRAVTNGKNIDNNFDDFSSLNSDDDVNWNFSSSSSGDIEWEVD